MAGQSGGKLIGNYAFTQGFLSHSNLWLYSMFSLLHYVPIDISIPYLFLFFLTFFASHFCLCFSLLFFPCETDSSFWKWYWTLIRYGTDPAFPKSYYENFILSLWRFNLVFVIRVYVIYSPKTLVGICDVRIRKRHFTISVINFQIKCRVINKQKTNLWFLNKIGNKL